MSSTFLFSALVLTRLDDGKTTTTTTTDRDFVQRRRGPQFRGSSSLMMTTQQPLIDFDAPESYVLSETPAFSAPREMTTSEEEGRPTRETTVPLLPYFEQSAARDDVDDRVVVEGEQSVSTAVGLLEAPLLSHTQSRTAGGAVAAAEDPPLPSFSEDDENHQLLPRPQPAGGPAGGNENLVVLPQVFQAMESLLSAAQAAAAEQQREASDMRFHLRLAHERQRELQQQLEFARPPGVRASSSSFVAPPLSNSSPPLLSAGAVMAMRSASGGKEATAGRGGSAADNDRDDDRFRSRMLMEARDLIRAESKVRTRPPRLLPCIFVEKQAQVVESAAFHELLSLFGVSALLAR